MVLLTHLGPEDGIPGDRDAPVEVEVLEALPEHIGGGLSLVKLSSPLLLTPGLSGSWHMTSIRAFSMPYPSPMVSMDPSIPAALILGVQ